MNRLLKDCLDGHALDNWAKKEVQKWRKVATEEGFTGAEANIQAVKSYIQSLKSERENIISQIRASKKAGDVVAEKKLKSGKTRVTLKSGEEKVVTPKETPAKPEKAETEKAKKPAARKAKKPATKTKHLAVVTDKSVRDHPQQVFVYENSIKIVSRVGRKKAAEYSFPRAEWEATFRHPNPNYPQLKLIEKYTRESDEQPGGPEQAARIRDSQISAIKKAFNKTKTEQYSTQPDTTVIESAKEWAENNGVAFDGYWEDVGAYQFTDQKTRATFTANNRSELQRKVETARGQYTTEEGNSTLELSDFQRAFPKARVGYTKLTDGSTSVSVRFSDGNALTIHTVPEITGDSVAYEAGYGKQKPSGEFVGKYSNGKIYLKKDKSGRMTLDHEKMHALEDMGYVTKEEISVLNRHIKKLMEAGKWMPKTQKADAKGRPRVTAEDRAQWIAENLENRRQKGILGKILQKIRDLVDALVNLHHRTAKGILKDVESGKATQRKGTPGKGKPRFMYAGEKAQHTPAVKSAMSDAVRREQAGEDASEGSKLHKETGWFLGWDNKWRFEISDRNISPKSKALQQRWADRDRWEEGRLAWPLKDFITHDALFRAYPQLKNVDVIFAPQKELGDGNVDGRYSIKENAIYLSHRLIEWGDVKSTLLHEIQHAIQEIEGFARGGSPDEGIITKQLQKKQRELSEREKQIRKDAQDYIFSRQNAGDKRTFGEIKDEYWDKNPEKFKELETIDTELFNLPTKSAYEGYRHLAGEIEARDTSARADLTPEQRKKQKPYASQGIPKEDAIVRFGKHEQYSTIADPTVREAKKIFGPKKVKIRDRVKEAFENRESLATKLVDRFHPIKALGETAYMLHRGVGGVQSVLNSVMEHGMLRWNGKFLDHQKNEWGGFLDWVDTLGEDADMAFEYIAAQRAKQIIAADKRAGLTPDDKKWRVTLTEEQIELIEKAAGKPKSRDSWATINKEFQQWNKNILDIATEAGIINREERKQWEQEWYVPFYRVFQDEETRLEYIKGPRKGKQNLSAKIYALKGSDRTIGDPLENVLQNWTHLISESLRNQARATAFEQSDGINTRNIDGKLVPVIEKVSAGDIMIFKTAELERKYQTKQGEKKSKYKITFGSKKTGEPVLSFQQDGKTVYFRVNDPELYVAMSHFAQNAEFLNNPVIKAMTASRRWLTYGATFGPAFRVANMIRDSLHTAIISKDFKPFFDSWKGFIKVWREHPDFKAYVASGHAFAGSYTKADDPKAATKYIRRITKKEGESAKDRILDTGAKILHFWERVGDASENAARVQLYSKRLGQGVEHGKAAFEARDLLDFQMKGTNGIVQFITATVPFTNARMQGLYRMGRAAKEDPKSVALKTSMLTVASLALWAAYSDDDRYKELEDWDRWAYYHFWIGDQHFRIPKPFETGAIASTIPEAFANVAKGNDEFKHIFDTIAQVAFDTFALNPIPQLGRPLVEAYFNKSMFTGRDIVGTRLEGLPVEKQYDPWTSATARLAGKLKISPKKAEHILRGYFASIGMAALWTSDMALKTVGDYPDIPVTIQDYPLVGRFVRDKTPRWTKYQTTFYELADEMDKTYRALKQAQDGVELKEIIKDKKKLLAWRKAFGRVRRSMSKINNQMRIVMNSRTMPVDEKQKTLERLAEHKNKLTERMVKMYKQAEKT